MRTTTERTLRWLRADGWMVAVVEKWVPRTPRKGAASAGPAGIRVDLFGCFDVVAVKLLEGGTLYVQTTTRAHLKERVEKVKRRRAAYVAALAGNQVWVLGWRRVVRRGREVWEPDVVELGPDDFDPSQGFDDDKQRGEIDGDDGG